MVFSADVIAFSASPFDGYFGSVGSVIAGLVSGIDGDFGDFEQLTNSPDTVTNVINKLRCGA